MDPMDKSHKDPDDIDLSERYHSSRNTSSLLYPKLDASPRPPPKISLDSGRGQRRAV